LQESRWRRAGLKLLFFRYVPRKRRSPVRDLISSTLNLAV
jgi:hypothetical protein